MRVTYLYHSGVLAELENVNLLFDYYRGDLPPLPEEKPLLVFVSHKHEDHFRGDLLQLGLRYPGARFIISREVERPIRYQTGYDSLKEKIFPVVKREKYDFECGTEKIIVETLRSTDLGVAFLVSAEEMSVYHAGDLNWWLSADMDKPHRDNIRKYYTEELERLRGRRIDLACLPTDGRMGEQAGLGAAYFIRELAPRAVLPIHFWDDFSVPAAFAEKVRTDGFSTKILLPERAGQVFTAEKGDGIWDWK